VDISFSPDEPILSESSYLLASWRGMGQESVSTIEEWWYWAYGALNQILTKAHIVMKANSVFVFFNSSEINRDTSTYYLHVAGNVRFGLPVVFEEVEVE
jgi:hypothetical protein